jgi:hypothetical protein
MELVSRLAGLAHHRGGHRWAVQIWTSLDDCGRWLLVGCLLVVWLLDGGASRDRSMLQLPRGLILVLV